MKYSFNEKKHLHLLDDKALTGTSSVLSVVAKPLTYWASGLAVAELGWTNPKFTNKDERMVTASVRFAEIKELDNDSYLELLDKAYKAHATKLKDSASKGTDRHSMVESWVKAKIAGEEMPLYDPTIESFVLWAGQNVKKFLFSEIYTYSEKLWLGGICDVGAEMNDGTIAVIDIKSSKEAYASQYWQCAGYAIQLEESGGYTEKGEKIFELQGKVGALIIFPFGAKEPKGEIRFDVDKNKEAFRACLTIYRQLNQIEK